MKKNKNRNTEPISKVRFIDHVMEKNSDKPPLVAGVPKEVDYSIIVKQHNNEKNSRQVVILKWNKSMWFFTKD